MRIFALCLTLTIASTPAVEAAMLPASPFPIARLTPSMMEQIEASYPLAAVDCLKSSLDTVAGDGHVYQLAYDYQLGQLWVISFDDLDGKGVRPYICSPKGLAKTPREAMEIMMGGGLF